jgi:1-acyl-sn-glycerol-3-phosphate acyltransferase
MRTRPGVLVNLIHLTALGFLGVLFRILNRTEVFGRENIPKRGERGVLFLCNHISTFDPFLIGVTAMPRFSEVWWRAAAKEDLFQTSFSRIIMYLIGAFPVKRGQHDQKSMDRMVESLQTDVLVVFPEGTWSFSGQLLPGRVGVGKVIYQAKPRKILPVAVKGWFPRIGQHAKIIFGKPIHLDHFYSMPDNLDTAREIVKVVMKEIGELSNQIEK